MALDRAGNTGINNHLSASWKAACPLGSLIIAKSKTPRSHTLMPAELGRWEVCREGQGGRWGKLRTVMHQIKLPSSLTSSEPLPPPLATIPPVQTWVSVSPPLRRQTQTGAQPRSPQARPQCHGTLSDRGPYRAGSASGRLSLPQVAWQEESLGNHSWRGHRLRSDAVSPTLQDRVILGSAANFPTPSTCSDSPRRA